jgi:hypothetical protein
VVSALNASVVASPRDQSRPCLAHMDNSSASLQPHHSRHSLLPIALHLSGDRQSSHEGHTRNTRDTAAKDLSYLQEGGGVSASRLPAARASGSKRRQTTTCQATPS